MVLEGKSIGTFQYFALMEANKCRGKNNPEKKEGSAPLRTAGEEPQPQDQGRGKRAPLRLRQTDPSEQKGPTPEWPE